MGLHRIALGGGDRLAQLFSYPNNPESKETLADTVLYWFGQTLANDGITKEQARVSIEVSGTKDYTLVLDGDDTLAPSFALYGERLPRFLDNGWSALTTVVPTLERDGRWDPIAKSSPPTTYRPWKFFLPLGMAMVNQRSVQATTRDRPSQGCSTSISASPWCRGSISSFPPRSPPKSFRGERRPS